MTGTLGYLRGATRCLLCNGEHEPGSVSFGLYGSVSICPGHPVKSKRAIKAGKGSQKAADEIIGRAQGK